MVTTFEKAQPLEYTPAVERATAAAYDRLKNVIPDVEWPVHAPYIADVPVRSLRGAANPPGAWTPIRAEPGMA